MPMSAADVKAKLNTYLTSLLSSDYERADLLGQKYRIIVLLLKVIWFAFMVACFSALVFHTKMIVVDYAEENTVTDVVILPTDPQRLWTSQCVHADMVLSLPSEYDSSPFLKSNASLDIYLFNYLARLSQSVAFFLERFDLWFDISQLIPGIQRNYPQDAQRLSDIPLQQSRRVENRDIPLSQASGTEALPGMKELRARSLLYKYLHPVQDLSNINLVRQNDSWFLCFSVPGPEINLHLYGAVVKDERKRQVGINSYPTPLSEITTNNPLWYTHRFVEIDMVDIIKVDALKYTTTIGSQLNLLLYDNYKKRHGGCVDAPLGYKIPVGQGDDFCLSACMSQSIEDRFKCNYLDTPAKFFTDYTTYSDTCNSLNIVSTLIHDLTYLDIWRDMKRLPEEGQLLSWIVMNKNVFLKNVTVACQQKCKHVQFCQEWEFAYNERLVSLSLTNLAPQGCVSSFAEIGTFMEYPNTVAARDSVYYDPLCWAGGSRIVRTGLFPLKTTRTHKKCLNWTNTGYESLGHHPFCSNPRGDDGPWCYTSYTNPSLFAWNYCVNYTCDGHYISQREDIAPRFDIERKCVEQNDIFMDGVCFNTSLPYCLSEKFVWELNRTRNGTKCSDSCYSDGDSLPRCTTHDHGSIMSCYYDCAVRYQQVFENKCWNSAAAVKGIDLVIPVNISRMHIPCENWLEHAGVHLFTNKDWYVLNKFNLCTSFSSGQVPWCLIKDANSSLSWQFCFNYTCDFTQHDILVPTIDEGKLMPLNATAFCKSATVLGTCWNLTDVRCQEEAYYEQTTTTWNNRTCDYGTCKPSHHGPVCRSFDPLTGKYYSMRCFRICSDTSDTAGVLANGEHCYYTDFQQNMETVFNSTREGYSCLNWREIYHEHYFTTGNHSYCLNPDGDVASWCFYRNTNNETDWDYCVNSTCYDNHTLVGGANKINQTGYCAQKTLQNKTCWNTNDQKCAGEHSGHIDRIYHTTTDRKCIAVNRNIDYFCKFRNHQNLPSCFVESSAGHYDIFACYPPCNGSCLQQSSSGEYCWDHVSWEGYGGKTDECIGTVKYLMPTTTTTGEACISWNNSVSIYPQYGSHRRCLNPAELKTGPWCYYRLSSGRITAASCFVDCSNRDEDLSISDTIRQEAASVPGDSVVNMTDLCLITYSNGDICWNWNSPYGCTGLTSYLGNKSTTSFGELCANKTKCTSGHGMGPRCFTDIGKWEFCFAACTETSTESFGTSASEEVTIAECLNEEKQCWRSDKIECALSDKIYTGTKQWTSFGECTRWNEVLPVYGKSHNYCRNPTFDRYGPHCYVTENNVNWDRYPCFSDCADESLYSPIPCFNTTDKCWKHDIRTCTSGAIYQGNKITTHNDRLCESGKCRSQRNQSPSCSIGGTTFDCFTKCKPDTSSCIRNGCFQWNHEKCTYTESKGYAISGNKCLPFPYTEVSMGKQTLVIMMDGICRRHVFEIYLDGTYTRDDTLIPVPWCFTNSTDQMFELCHKPCEGNQFESSTSEIITDSLWIDRQLGLTLVDDDTPDITVDLVANANHSNTEICVSITFQQHAGDYITVYKERLDTTFVELLADIGGIIGLYFGFSALTIIHIVYYFVRRYLRRRLEDQLNKTKSKIQTATQSRMIMSTFINISDKPDDAEEIEPADPVGTEVSYVTRSDFEKMMQRTNDLENEIRRLKTGAK